MLDDQFTLFWAFLFGVGLVGEVWALLLARRGPTDGTLSKLVRYIFGFSTPWKWARWAFAAVWTWFGLHIMGVA